ISSRMLDKDILPWIGGRRPATDVERHRASTIVADRLCGSISDPIIRNAQEKRQLAIMAAYLKRKGYNQQSLQAGQPLVAMQPGTFAFRVNVVVGDVRKVKLPIDVVIQPKVPRKSKLPILMEAKSAGDFTNVNKRRKEEATKMHQLRATYGDGVEFILLLCGYFDSGYLGYEAAEGMIKISGLAGLYCYFLLLADAWLADGGFGIWLIPSEFMDVNYGQAVKRYLTEDVKLVHIHRFCPADVQFSDALVSSAVVVFEKTLRPP